MGQATKTIIDSEMCEYQNQSLVIDEDLIMESSYAGVSLKKGPWTDAEDEILRDYVMKYGKGNWIDIHKSTGLLRNGKSCRLRWVNHLKPGLRKGAFTLKEERLIFSLQAKVGNKWSLMTKYLPGRTDNDIKNFWNTKLKRLRRAGLPHHPSELCSQALPGSRQAHGYRTSSSGDKCHHAMEQAINFDTPDSLYSGLKVGKENLPCTQECSMSVSGKMASNPSYSTSFQLHRHANDRHKRFQESPTRLRSSGHSTRRSVFLSRAYLTKSCDKSSHLLSSFPVHHLPAYGVKLDPMGFELPSIQNLPCLPLQSFDDFQNVPSPVEYIKLETPSDTGLLGSLLPDFNASNSTADPFPMVPSSFSHLEATSGLNPRQMEQKHLVSPTSSFGPLVLPFHDSNSPTSTSTSLSFEQPVVYTFPGCDEFVEHSPSIAETDELSNWLNLSSVDEFLDVDCIRQDATCGNNGSIDIVPPTMSQLTGSCVLNPGKEYASYAWMPY